MKQARLKRVHISMLQTLFSYCEMETIKKDEKWTKTKVSCIFKTHLLYLLGRCVTLTSLNPLLFKLKLNFSFLQNNLSYWGSQLYWAFLFSKSSLVGVLQIIPTNEIIIYYLFFFFLIMPLERPRFPLEGFERSGPNVKKLFTTVIYKWL
jgi:hypothetical protein